MYEWILFVIGIVVGAVAEYIYEKKRDWKLNEILEVIQMVTKNEKVKEMLKKSVKDNKELEEIINNL